MENSAIQQSNKEKDVIRSRMKKVIIFFLAIFFLFFIVFAFTEDNSVSTAFRRKKNCNVAAIKLQGVLLTYDVDMNSIQEKGGEENGEENKEELQPKISQVSSEYIVDMIENAESDEKIKAILLEIDSPGGSVVAGEEVANALKRAQKPTVAVIRDMGTSAAYWSATGADTIFASTNSSVGSIGVTMSYLDNAEKNKKDGLFYNQLSSGRFKDMGSYDKTLTEEERDLLMRDVNIIYDNFVKAVSRNRNIEIERLRELADGSSVTGQTALKKGLIDRIGDTYTAKKYLQEKINDDVVPCW